MTLVKKISTDINKVISNGYCVGCGSCVVKAKKNAMQLNNYGQYIPKFYKKDNIDKNDKYCPFSSKSLNENEISKIVFKNKSMKYNSYLGKYKSVHVGFEKSSLNLRKSSSSGGLTTWLLHELMLKGDIDAFISVGWSSKKKIFQYQIFDNLKKIKDSSKTRYYPVEFSQVIKNIDKNKKYAFVGVPCYIKALRNHSIHNPVIKNSIKYYVSILCGHQKNRLYFDHILKSLKVLKKDISSFDFRHKIKDKPANKYGIEVNTVSKKKIITPVKNIFANDWGLNFFKYKACDFCDDISGETADISFGDAWLNKEAKDYRGHNIIVNRNLKLESILKDGMNNKSISLRRSNTKEFFLSQKSSYNHRREGLMIRINEKKNNNDWYPKKRNFNKNFNLKLNIIKKYRQRVILQKLSNVKYVSKKLYFKTIIPIIKYHYYSKNLLRFLVRESLRILLNLLNNIKKILFIKY